MKEETHRIQVPEYKLSSGESVAVAVVVVVVAVVVGNLAVTRWNECVPANILKFFTGIGNANAYGVDHCSNAC